MCEQIETQEECVLKAQLDDCQGRFCGRIADDELYPACGPENRECIVVNALRIAGTLLQDAQTWGHDFHCHCDHIGKTHIGETRTHILVRCSNWPAKGLCDWCGANSPLKKSFWLQAVEIHQLGVAKSRHIFGYACDSAP